MVEVASEVAATVEEALEAAARAEQALEAVAMAEEAWVMEAKAAVAALVREELVEQRKAPPAAKRWRIWWQGRSA